MNSSPRVTGLDRCSGDLAAMYRVHREALLRFLRTRARDAAEAEDVLQELWLRVSRVRSIPISNGRAYLYQMGSNLIVDRARERRRRGVRDKSWAVMTYEVAGHSRGECQTIDPAARPDDILSGQEEFRRLVVALAGLPQRSREAFFLHKIQGKSHKEVALRMGISLSAVEKRMAGAMKFLRIALAS